MNGRVWLRLWYLWVPPAALLAANVVWLAGVRGKVLGRGSALAREVASSERDVSKLESEQRELEQTAQRLTRLRENIGALRQQQMAPMRERLIPFLTDLFERTAGSGLHPDRVSYTVKREKKSGLVYFSAHFDVKGNYEQIRRCVYALESSPQFLLLEGLTLRGNDTPSSLDVGVNLGVGTYFADVDEKLMQQLGAREVTSDD